MSCITEPTSDIENIENIEKENWIMKMGKEYLVGLNEAPSIEPKEGGWALIRYDTGGSTAVSPVVTTRTPWARSVHVFALADGPDPALNLDRLVYRDEAGEGESRIIVSFALLG